MNAILGDWLALRTGAGRSKRAAIVRGLAAAGAEGIDIDRDADHTISIVTDGSGPQELARPVLFPCCNAASSTAGAILPVDGGFLGV